MGEIEADPLHQGQRRAALRRDRERPGRLLDRGLSRPGVPGTAPSNSGRKPASFVEQAVDQHDRATGLVLVEQCLVGGGVERRRLCRRGLARQCQKPVRGPVRRRQKSSAGRAARHTVFRYRTSSRQRRNEVGGKCRGMPPFFGASPADWLVATARVTQPRHRRRRGGLLISGAVRVSCARNPQGRKLLGSLPRPRPAASIAAWSQ